MTDLTESNLTFTKLLSRHWRLCLVVVASCIGLASLTFVLAPRKYQSEMKLLVNNERADLVITAGKTPTDTQRSDLTETEVNSEMELLRSRDILAAVVRDAKLYRPPHEINPAPPTPSSLERAVISLERTLNVSSIRKTNIISVSYTAPDPDLAEYVVRDLGDRYLSAHLAAHSEPGTYKFFADEVARYRQQVADAQAALSDFQRQTEIFSMPQQSAAVVNRLEDARAQFNDLNGQIREEVTRIEESDRQLQATSDRLVTQVREVPNQGAVQQLKVALTDQENRRIALAAKFRPGDRAITELDKEIENTKHALNQMQTGAASERTSDVNTIHQSLQADRMKSAITLQGLMARRKELEKTVGAYVSRLDGMNQNASQLQDLEEAERQAEDNYLNYSRRLEEARMAEALDSQKFANVTVIEKPVSSPIPASPKLASTLAMGMFLGFVLSLALAFVLENRGKEGGAPKLSLSPEYVREPVFSASAGD
jgi:uncharacterized protein involved in exopolysaccharide biosynthesis